MPEALQNTPTAEIRLLKCKATCWPCGPAQVQMSANPTAIRHILKRKRTKEVTHTSHNVAGGVGLKRMVRERQRRRDVVPVSTQHLRESCSSWRS